MVVFVALILFVWMVIAVLTDVFRRHDAGGGRKVAWTLFVIFVPLIGVFAYLIANGDGMASRSAENGRHRTAGHGESAGSGGAAEIERAKTLLESGTITQAEFEGIKSRALR
jgi:Phospholipase_D-nuclease N-terminal